MKNLSTFIKDKIQSLHLLEKDDVIVINNIDEAECAASSVCCGNLINEKLVFNTTTLKNIFLENVMIHCSNAKIINCNCSIDRFYNNDFDGLLIFNNLLQCKHQDILNEIKNYKGIFIC